MDSRSLQDLWDSVSPSSVSSPSLPSSSSSSAVIPRLPAVSWAVPPPARRSPHIASSDSGSSTSSFPPSSSTVTSRASKRFHDGSSPKVTRFHAGQKSSNSTPDDCRKKHRLGSLWGTHPSQRPPHNSLSLSLSFSHPPNAQQTSKGYPKHAQVTKYSHPTC